MRDASTVPGAPSRLRAALVVAGLLAAVATVAASCDRPVAEWATHVPESQRRYWYLITSLGTSGYMLVASSLTGLGALWARDRRRAGAQRRPLTTTILGSAYFFASVASSGILAQVVKHAVGRARPRLMGQWGAFHCEPFSIRSVLASFPSGHATTAFAAAVALGHLFPRSRRRWLVMATLIGLSRIMVGEHYSSDVVAGALLGWLVSRTLAPFLDRRMADDVA